MTRRPMPVPKEFAEVFVRNGWRKCERMWGKASAQVYRRAIGCDILENMKKELRGD